MIVEPDVLQDTGDDFRPTYQEAELRRIVRSSTFSRSPRLAALLTHICERSWAGQTDELSEQQIGIHFYHRPPGFNAGEDAIVRGSARHLRKRLELYYQSEGKGNPARIHVPKGGYVAYYEEHDAAEALPPMVNTTPEARRHAAASRNLRWVWTLSVLTAALVLVTFGWRRMHGDRTVQNDGPRILWSALFQPNRRTVIVAGDSALNLYTAYVHHEVPLRVYMEQEYQNDPAIKAISPEGPGMLSRVNAATMADLKLTSELVRVPYREKLDVPDKNVEVRYARDVNQADLAGANLVLLGASTFDPWVSVYDRNLDFHLDRGFEHYTFQVLNRHARSGELPVITKGNDEALTTVAFAESPSGNEHVLLIGGSTMGSVYAAEHFLFTQKMWQPILESATINGRLHDFEVVLRSTFVKDEVSDTSVVAWHVH